LAMSTAAVIATVSILTQNVSVSVDTTSATIRPMQTTPAAIEQPAQCFQVPAPAGTQPAGTHTATTPTLFAWRQCPANESPDAPPAILYICGATFASEQAVGFRFDGVSWADELVAAGFELWGFDFVGYGRSDRYPQMSESPDACAPLGRAPDAADQLERVVRFICDQRGGGRVNLLAHSWGTMPAALLAADHPELVDRLVFFAPIVRRAGGAQPNLQAIGAWYPLGIPAQRQRFTQDLPAGHAPVLLDRHFARWASGYLDSEPQPPVIGMPTVRTPAGPAADILAAWAGELPYDPVRIQAPLCIIRGEWDSLCTDADARWLWDALAAAPLKRDVKIGKGTHMLHLEEARHVLYRETLAFLGEADSPPVVDS
jgi:pimeloyl-ACP methyl ester carboxylesterase